MTKNNESVNKRTLEGVVVSDKMSKTRVVKVTTRKAHSLYVKSFSSSKKYKVHDEENRYKEGEKVIIQETRPLSKTKRWVIVSKA
jgi:small subunit ribosomal protein S17